MTQGITTNGWFFLVFGWGFILTLTIYCFSASSSPRSRRSSSRPAAASSGPRASA